jgi:NADH:ubiquinone oxidoreductase subunit 3 (subunit A)
MLAEYSGVLVVLGFVAAAWVAVMALHTWLGPSADPVARAQGEAPLDSRQPRVLVPFHCMALVIVIVGAGSVLFFPWAAVLRELGWSALGSMAAFAVPIAIGVFHGWRRGSFQW